MTAVRLHGHAYQLERKLHGGGRKEKGGQGEAGKREKQHTTSRGKQEGHYGGVGFFSAPKTHLARRRFPACRLTALLKALGPQTVPFLKFTCSLSKFCLE